MKVVSGSHLGVVREFIKWNARNVSQVTWGSQELLQLNLTVEDLEQLAQNIRNKTLKEVFQYHTPCSSYDPDWGDRGANFCRTCGFHRSLHELHRDLIESSIP